MSLEKIYDMAVELGKAIAETEEFKDMKQSELAIMRNEDAAGLVEKLNNAKRGVERKKMLGELTEADAIEMGEIEKEVLSNQVVKQSFEANAMFNNFMQKISVKIRDGIREKSDHLV
ncbi:YlbF family regulator [Desulfofarcimen acetoxidans]|uniref:YlbF family regulator n=1 Tax=Desulfofarcimen acetoxidans TaxID=58138 RepID=UPI0002DF5EB5|nr:YlbF family regulator [Desulfofarcimen acetoxidans]